MSLITGDDCTDSPRLQLVQPKSYTLAELMSQARDYIEQARKTWAEEDVVDTELQLSLFLAWVQRREKENK